MTASARTKESLTGTILDAPAATEGVPSGTPEGGSSMEWDPGAGVAFGQLFGAVLETLSDAGTEKKPPVGCPPIPMRTVNVTAHASELIWLNVPPARVWVYRKAA